MLAVYASAALGVEQGTAGVHRAASRGRRRAEVDGCIASRSEVNWQPRRSLAGGVMGPAGTRGCVSRWFDTGCATMLRPSVALSTAVVRSAASSSAVFRFHC